MIKIPKKPLYNDNTTSRSFLKLSPLKEFFCLFLFFILYLLAPLYLAIHHRLFSFQELAVFYLFNILVISYLARKTLNKKYQFQIKSQDLQEKINILKDQNSSDSTNQQALADKINRYYRLTDIIEKINQSLALDSIAENLVTISHSLLANNKGACSLYLVDPQTQRLSLFKSQKENSDLVIKSKEGDIFDFWVVKHTSPLLIENIKEDFRFDLEKLESQDARRVCSLVSAPFISENKFLGLLRLDNPNPGFYSQDELRLLVTLCDLGAVALENGELFQKTQDLAIHDSLTLLYTKGYFLERLSQEHKRSNRQNTSFSVLMLDIDYFKNYNDTLGHIAGDMVLKMLSNTIVTSLKKIGAIVSRFGGEEFCIILPDIDKPKAIVIAEELRAKIKDTKIVLRRNESSITVSIGVATFPVDSRDEDEIVFKADKAMYEAKQKGRNRIAYAR